MAYLMINNYSRLGTIGIHQNAISSIALHAVEALPGVSVHDARKDVHKEATGETSMTLPSGIKTTLSKDGKATIYIDVVLVKSDNLKARCIEIQKTISDAIRFACDSIVADVHVRVIKIL